MTALVIGALNAHLICVKEADGSRAFADRNSPAATLNKRNTQRVPVSLIRVCHRD
jgi:hypothetical protein